MPRSTGVISMLIAALRLTLPSSANSKPVSRSSTDTDWLRLVATLDDPGTGRGRVEHARAARWLASQRLRNSMRYGNVLCHHNRNPFLEVNFVDAFAGRAEALKALEWAKVHCHGQAVAKKCKRCRKVVDTRQEWVNKTLMVY